MASDGQRSAFRRLLKDKSDVELLQMLRASKLLKRELILQEIEARKRSTAMTAKRSWSRELAGQVQLPPKEHPKNRPAVAAIALFAAAAIAALTLLLRYFGII